MAADDCAWAGWDRRGLVRWLVRELVRVLALPNTSVPRSFELLVSTWNATAFAARMHVPLNDLNPSARKIRVLLIPHLIGF